MILLPASHSITADKFNIWHLDDIIDSWVDRIQKMIDLKKDHPEQIVAMSERAKEHVRNNFSWSTALADILSERDDNSFLKNNNMEKNGSGKHEKLNINSSHLNEYLNKELGIASESAIRSLKEPMTVSS